MSQKLSDALVEEIALRILIHRTAEGKFNIHREKSWFWKVLAKDARVPDAMVRKLDQYIFIPAILGEFTARSVPEGLIRSWGPLALVLAYVSPVTLCSKHSHKWLKGLSAGTGIPCTVLVAFYTNHVIPTIMFSIEAHLE